MSNSGRPGIDEGPFLCVGRLVRDEAELQIDDAISREIYTDEDSGAPPRYVRLARARRGILTCLDEGLARVDVEGDRIVWYDPVRSEPEEDPVFRPWSADYDQMLRDYMQQASSWARNTQASREAFNVVLGMPVRHMN